MFVIKIMKLFTDTRAIWWHYWKEQLSSGMAPDSEKCHTSTCARCRAGRGPSSHIRYVTLCKGNYIYTNITLVGRYVTDFDISFLWHFFFHRKKLHSLVSLIIYTKLLWCRYYILHYMHIK